MTPHVFYRTQDRSTIIDVVERAGTNLPNFRQIALYNGPVSARLARRLEQASGSAMTLREILFPEEFDGHSTPNAEPSSYSE